jgi:hypothetical protein
MNTACCRTRCANRHMAQASHIIAVEVGIMGFECNTSNEQKKGSRGEGSGEKKKATHMSKTEGKKISEHKQNRTTDAPN